MKELPKTYNPNETEDRIYRLWQDSGAFAPADGDGKPFSIIMPPPNANAPLHAGHAVFVTLEDMMIRYHRMKGEPTLWLPGADHAGFETQVVFEKKLEKQGRNRFEMSREELYKETLEYTLENKKTMETQLRKLGASCDWSREKFTLDPKIIKIVYQTFKDLYDDGLAYRDFRPVNWCSKHQTSLSDLEVKYEEQIDPLYYIKYGHLTLATVRPETKFGDTAVAVHPDDKRYQKYIGQEIEIETVLGPTKIKVIADTMVDPKFGTGVVKITPAHDPNDFEVSRRHNLEIKEVIDQYGRLNEKTGPFKGLKILEAREKVVAAMKEKGLIEKIDENYTHTVGRCYKCRTVIEPRLLTQWFIAVNKKGEKTGKKLAADALAAVDAGNVKFVSKKFEKVYRFWMENIRDWNVSRQIAWGIQIPAWYCEAAEAAAKSTPTKIGFAGEVVEQVLAGKTKTYRLRDHELKTGNEFLLENSATSQIFGLGKIIDVAQTKVSDINLKDPKHGKTYEKAEELIAAFGKHYPDQQVDLDTAVWVYEYEFKPLCPPIVSAEKPQKCSVCGGKMIQDPDVFDTWFSSGQWPFASLLANSEADFERFYPTSVMETGWDILFFWVARMIMLGLYVTGKVPFKNVYLHGLVRDADRKKMSKSKGNVIDPLGISETYGTDAFRLALIFGAGIGTDVILDENKVRGMRNFANKTWNIARFVLTNLGNSKSQTLNSKQIPNPKSQEDKVILEKLDNIIKSTSDHLDNFRFGQAAEGLYEFIWHDLADVYIENSKSQILNPKLKENTTLILLFVLRNSLLLLHPFAPFLSEEIWQILYQNKLVDEKLLMAAKWPENSN